jgi:hypothetical protein
MATDNRRDGAGSVTFRTDPCGKYGQHAQGELSMEHTIACPSCGASRMEQYCGHCGEKRLTNHDLSIRHYLGELLEIITHFDSKVLRSLWGLLRRPGSLSADHFAGRRVRYVAPLRLFVLLSVIYFFSNSIFPYNAFTTPLETQLHMNNFYPGFAATQVERAMQRQGLDYATLERRYDAKTAILSKTMVFALIPVFALVFWLVLFKKRRYFSEHLIVATHFWSFALLLIGVFIPLFLALITRLGGLLGVPPDMLRADIIPTTVLQVSFAAYLFVMLRRVYEVTYWYSGLVAGAIAWSFFFTVWLYRFLLFMVTLRTL